MSGKIRNFIVKMASFALVLSLFLTSTVLTLGNEKAIASNENSSSPNNIYRLIAIGDSIAAGYEFGFTEQSTPYGYSDHMYEQALMRGLRTEYSNYGVLGLKSSGLLNWLQAAAAGNEVNSDDIQANLIDPRAADIFADTTKLGAELREADLIVASIGGNDFTASLNKVVAGEAIASVEDELAVAIDGYAANTEAALRVMLRLQPDVQIIIANQYLPVPGPRKIKDTYIYTPNEAAYNYLLDTQRQIIERLELMVAKLAGEGYNVKITDAAQVFKDKEFNLTSILRKDIHPNAEGYKELGKAYSITTWDEFRTLLPREKDEPISIVVNGEELKTEFKPVIIKGRTFLSLRDVIDAVGAELDWDPKTNTASIKLDGRVVDITIDATTYRVNGETLTLNAVPAYLNKTYSPAKTYVPLAALSEGLGFQVVYRETLKAAFINR